MYIMPFSGGKSLNNHIGLGNDQDKQDNEKYEVVLPGYFATMYIILIKDHR